jgi:phosphoribosyl 1,2-cyclic phosphodiesterase
MPCYGTKGTFSQLGFNDPNLIIIESGKAIKTDNDFTFVAFDVRHNALEPVNFIFKNTIGEYGIYITDTSEIKLKLPNIRPTLIIIEANFDRYEMETKLKESAKIVKRDRGYETIFKTRQLSDDKFGHLSWQSAVEVLKTMKLGLCKQIVLCHLSPSNSFDYFAQRVSEALGNKIPVKQLKPFEIEITTVNQDSNDRNIGF